MRRLFRQLRSTVRFFSVGSVVSGMIGGALIALLAAGGRFGYSTKTVTVGESPIAATGAPPRMAELTARQIYARDAPGVVYVNATGVSASQSASEYLKGEGGEQATATGSGFEIDGNGTILTNWHVIENATKITVSFEHGKTVTASIISKDPSNDLALLHVPTEGLKLYPLALGDSGKTQVGDPVLAIGNPFGLGRTLTTGVISALQRQITAPNGQNINNALQTDAPINPGNSGGPLLNEEGRVIAINSQIETNGGNGNTGIAFAIPINTVKQELATFHIGYVREREASPLHPV